MSTAFALCLVVAQLSPKDGVTLDRVDLVEINHFHDEQGNLVFISLIFYEWSQSESRYHVRDWRLLKTPAQLPLRNWRTGDFVAVWHDFKVRNILRKVHAQTVWETWTQYDPELVEREFLPIERRRELRSFPVLSLSGESGESPHRVADRPLPSAEVRR